MPEGMGDALSVTVKVMFFAVPALAVMGGGTGWLLAKKSFPARGAVLMLVQLPVILPPTVTGFYILDLCRRFSFLKDAGVLFTLSAAVIGALVPALPIMIQSARAAFAGVPRDMEDAARTLGRSEGEIFTRITLPMARRTLVAGLAMASARAMGDFGVTLMIAGSIPGVTQTLPLYVYGRVEAMDFGGAHMAAAALVVTGVLCLYCISRLERSRHEVS